MEATRSSPGCFDRTNCPVCGTASSTGLPSPAPWQLAWCDGCEFAYLTNPPKYEALAGDFEWDKSVDTERTRRHVSYGWLGAGIAAVAARMKHSYRKLTKRDKLQALANDSNFTGDVVDVGCGDGCLWASLPDGCAPIGIEISPVMASRARSRLGGKRGRLIEADGLGGLQQLASSSADGAILISYLEHEARPVLMLRELRRVLRPGAHAILKLPNYSSWNRVLRGLRWCGFRFPDHVNYFTPRALRRILSKGGFEVVRFRWRDRAPTSDNMWLVARVPL